jgi:hypothetical protein
MTIADIAEVADLASRQVRYVIDQDLVEGLSPAPAGRGKAREFSEFEGFVIAMAAKLCHAGLSQRRVKQIMEAKGGAKKSRANESWWTEFRRGVAGFAVWNCNDSVDIRTNTLKLLARFEERTNGA